MTDTAHEPENAAAEARWFVLRVQSNREESVRVNLGKLLELEKVRDRVPQILVPTEAITEVRGGKRHVVQRKLYPGYVIVQVVVDEQGTIPQDLWQLIRETGGVGDFIGAEKPWPMSDGEVARILGQTEEVQEEAPKLKIDLKEGQMIQIKEGPFKSVEGYVEEVNPASGKVKVVINIFNRATPVELEYWQVQVL
ncbi:MAG: transcription termination/antitermination factor NusG [Candidatus Brocadiaceae bacterium]|nr:transcription termination/antitermination factor NusG [Candidatus Brocadiaceae bacterium]